LLTFGIKQPITACLWYLDKHTKLTASSPRRSFFILPTTFRIEPFKLKRIELRFALLCNFSYFSKKDKAQAQEVSCHYSLLMRRVEPTRGRGPKSVHLASTKFS
jgi:hypothetical protein